MSFDLTVVFTGLTGFVENTGASRARMCVLLPNGDPPRMPGTPPPTSSFDGSKLNRHRAFVRFPIANVSSLSNRLESRPLDDSEGIWYLRGDRVFFQIVEDPEQPGGNDFQINQTILPNAHHPRTAASLPLAQKESFSWALDMQRVFPGFQVDPLLLGRYPPASRLAAQVFIEGGTIATKSTTTAVWRFEPPLSSAPYEQILAHEVKLSFKRLVGARLMAHSFDPAQEPRFLDLTGLARGGQLLIEIVNTCDLNPLQWKVDEARPLPDEDSKWIFELADPDVADAIRAILKLGNRQLPIPVPVEVLTDGIGSPGSGNCIPPKLPATRFQCAELDGAGSYAGNGLAMRVAMPVPASYAEGATPLPPAGVQPRAQPPRRTGAAASAPAARPAIQYIAQRNDHWCWAACCAMALSQQGKNKQQCDIAGAFFNADCCSAGACDAECKVQQVEKVFRDNGLPQTAFLDRALSQQELASQLNAGGNTVAIGRRGAANHMVLVAGFSGQSFTVYDPDPNFAVGSVCFAEILQQAQGTGAWAWTWQNLK
jgi:hypothetical protein